MKKFNKYMSLAVVAVAGVGFATSCDDSKNNDYVSEYTGPSGVYFSNTANSYLELDNTQTKITYPVYRDVAGEELTVNVAVRAVDVYAPSGTFSFPSSVTFEKGSKVADFTISYNLAGAEVGVENQYQLTLDAESTPFASNSIVITLVNPAPWTLLGSNGTYIDYGMGLQTTVEVYQQDLDHNLYRISNPYYDLNEEETYLQFRVLEYGDVFMGQTIPDDNWIGYDMWYITYDSDFASNLYVAFPGYFFPDDLSAWQNNVVLEYQDNGLPGLVQVAPVYYIEAESSGLSYVNDPSIYINFPGYISLDTDIEIVYEGTLTTESQEQGALLNVTLGSDLTSARVAIMNLGSSYANAIANAIETDQIDYTEYNTSGYWQVPFDTTEPGTFTAVVVGYYNDEAKNYASTSFYYIPSSASDPNKGWNSLGYVDYTDGYMCAMFDIVPLTYRLEVQQNQSDNNLYRLLNPYGEPYPYNEPGDYVANIDTYLYFYAPQKDQVRVLESLQALNWGYGRLTCWSMADLALQNGWEEDEIAAAGYYGTWAADGKITFEPLDLIMSMADYQGGTYLTANFMADSTGNDYEYDQNGKIYAPFCINMGSLSSDPGNDVDEGMLINMRGSLIPMSASLTNNINIEKKTMKSSKLLKDNRWKLQKASFQGRR